MQNGIKEEKDNSFRRVSAEDFILQRSAENLLDLVVVFGPMWLLELVQRYMLSAEADLAGVFGLFGTPVEAHYSALDLREASAYSFEEYMRYDIQVAASFGALEAYKGAARFQAKQLGCAAAPQYVKQTNLMASERAALGLAVSIGQILTPEDK